MATNPMQRQARNSFLLGMVVTLLIAGVIVALLYMQVKKLNEQIKTEQASTTSVYVLNQDIKSGQIITPNMFSMQVVKRSGVPADATSDISTLINNYSLCDIAGNDIYRKADNSLYMMSGDKEVTVFEEGTRYYTQGANGAKNYIETTQKPLVAKVDIKANTVITGSLMARSDELYTDDVREQEYNMVVLPIELMTGDYVDIRLMFPTGQDYIVISKKRITVPSVSGEYLADTIQMKLAEEEILTMSSAIIEAAKMEGAKLYATKYTEAGLQEEASPTYVVNNEVANLIESDPNVVNEAMEALRARYNANGGKLTTMRNEYINNAISTYGDDKEVPTKVQESITNTKESRQKYLQSLTGTAPVTN